MDALTGQAAEGETEGPAIAGPLVAAIRALFRERGVWERVIAELEPKSPEVAEQMSRPELPAWIGLEDYGQLLDAAAAVVEPTTLVEIGRARVQNDLRGGYFGGMLRGWLRSVGSTPSDLLRICMHMWKGAVRDAGEMSVTETGEHHVRFALRDAAPLTLRSRPWHLVLQGIVEGVLTAGQLEGTVTIARDEANEDALDVLVRWTAQP